MPRTARSSAASGRERGIPRAATLALELLTGVFDDLELSASVVDLEGVQPSGGWSWFPIHSSPGVMAFEPAHGVEKRREAHNVANVDKARRTKTVVFAEHAGFIDAFVPLSEGDRAWGVLLCGPFASALPTSGDLLERWRWLTGKQGRVSDPEFVHYVASALATPTFVGARLEVFRRLLTKFAFALDGRASLDAATSEIAELRSKLASVRYAERMWKAAREMLEEPTWRGWQGRHRWRERGLMRIQGPPQHVVVGLLSARADTADPLEDILQREALQRACVELAQSTGHVVCGRIGSYGIALLWDGTGGASRVQNKLVDIGERARGLARKHGQRLHLGIAAPSPGVTLPASYQMALSAAERALGEGKSLVHADKGRRGEARAPLGELRKNLAQAAATQPAALASSFERYLAAVRVHAGYRFEPTKAHLDAGFDRIVEVLTTDNVLEARSLAQLQERLQRAGSESSTVDELARAYQRLIADVVLALSRPIAARQDRNLQSALEYIRDHSGEKLTLERAARVAGFAPRYFSRLFSKSEGTTFRMYLRRLRLERAKQLLSSTRWSIDRIARACGFESRIYFHRAFHSAYRRTPSDYRRRSELQNK